MAGGPNGLPRRQAQRFRQRSTGRSAWARLRRYPAPAHVCETGDRECCLAVPVSWILQTPTQQFLIPSATAPDAADCGRDAAHKGARRGALSLLQQLDKFPVFSNSVRRRLRLIQQQHGERRCRCQRLDETAQKLVTGHRSQQQMKIGKQMHQRHFVAAPLRIRLPPQVMPQVRRSVRGSDRRRRAARSSPRRSVSPRRRRPPPNPRASPQPRPGSARS